MRASKFPSTQRENKTRIFSKGTCLFRCLTGREGRSSFTVLMGGRFSRKDWDSEGKVHFGETAHKRL